MWVASIGLICRLRPRVSSVLFSSTDDTRGLSLQINPIDATHIGGGLTWQPGQPGMLVFSVLGTQVAFPM